MRLNYTFLLVAICVVVFILQNLFPAITDEFVLVSKDVLSRPWILVTSIFLHGSPDHLIYNMFALALFGSVLENVVGSRKFLIIFYATGIVASIGSVFFYEASLGASGAIMGIIGTLAILRPRMMIFTFGVPMPMIVAAGVWTLIDLAGMFYPSNVANAAHLFGLVSGVIIGLALRKRFFVRTEHKSNVIDEEDIDRWEDEYMK
jgi:membrane associated rhomboid family serine protease